MKAKIEKQIAIYTKRLNNMKENRANEADLLTDKEMASFDYEIAMTADFIRTLKGLIFKPTLKPSIILKKLMHRDGKGLKDIRRLDKIIVKGYKTKRLSRNPKY